MSNEKNNRTHLTPTSLLMEGIIATLRFSFAFFGIYQQLTKGAGLLKQAINHSFDRRKRDDMLADGKSHEV